MRVPHFSPFLREVGKVPKLDGRVAQALNAHAKYKVSAPLFAFFAKGGYDAACGAVLDLVENPMLQTASYPPLQKAQGLIG